MVTIVYLLRQCISHSLIHLSNMYKVPTINSIMTYWYLLNLSNCQDDYIYFYKTSLFKKIYIYIFFLNLYLRKTMWIKSFKLELYENVVTTFPWLFYSPLCLCLCSINIYWSISKYQQQFYSGNELVSNIYKVSTIK